jgi:hypothetical protein
MSAVHIQWELLHIPCLQHIYAVVQFAALLQENRMMNDRASWERQGLS